MFLPDMQTYLGIQIFRFYFKCTRCSAELTMKTDPQNSDYVVESGATRNYEPWRAEDEVTIIIYALCALYILGYFAFFFFIVDTV